MGLFSKVKAWLSPKKRGRRPHPTVRCPNCGSPYVRGAYSNRFECCDCGKIFS